jgi:LacI family transcriptional regulator
MGTGYRNRFPPPIQEEGSVATIADVARRAGVTKPTVSRVLNNSAPVAHDTRSRVLAAIEELGYQPSVVARGLARGRLHTIAVVVPFVTHPSAVARVQGMVNGFRESDMPVSLYDVERREDLDQHLLALTSHVRPEGAVIVSFRLSPVDLDRLNAANIPTVFLDVDVEGWPSVVTDDRAGGAMATRHLVELGHSRIGFVGDPEDGEFGFSSSRERRTGYRQALAEQRIEPVPGHERMGPHGREVASELADELLALPQRPTAIFAASDTQAIGVLEAAQRRGLRVPQELSVIGFDDIEAAAHLGLTTVRQPLAASGLEAARQVLDRVQSPHLAAIRHVLPLELVTRRTTTTAPERLPAHDR